jgi:mannose-6-phosphate isomerase-like protein (cupin superfamily)
MRVDLAHEARAVRPNLKDPRTRSFGHIAAASMSGPSPDEVSMRTARLMYSGITVKMMVDTDLGAQLQTMFMVQYEADGAAGPHDHPFEETYLILAGATDAMFDGQPYRLERGDIAWTGAGCVHSFRNAGREPVRWLETQAPQPPARYSYRFAGDWDYLREIAAPAATGGKESKETQQP